MPLATATLGIMGVWGWKGGRCKLRCGELKGEAVRAGVSPKAHNTKGEKKS